MKRLTKLEQKIEARKAYDAIIVPALKIYEAKCKEIDKQKDDIKIIDGKRYKLIEE